MTLQCIASSYGSFSIEEGDTFSKGNFSHSYQYHALDNVDQKNCNNSFLENNININYKPNYGNVLTKICMYSLAAIFVGCGSYLFWDSLVDNRSFKVPSYQNTQNISIYQNVSSHQLNCTCNQVEDRCAGVKTWIDTEGDRHFQQYTYTCLKTICKGEGCENTHKYNTSIGIILAGMGVLVFVCILVNSKNNRVIIHPPAYYL